MTTFNQLLRANGIDPDDVALLRHRTTRRGRTPHWLWENDRPAFLLYQSTQQDRLANEVQPIGSRSSIG